MKEPHWTASWNNAGRKSCLSLFAALSLPACDQRNPDNGAPALGTDHRPPARVLLTTQPDGIQEVVAARIAARARDRLLTFVPSDDVSRLMQEFTAASEERRAEILGLLGASRASEAWAFLLAQAGNGGREVRLAALDALAMHGGGDPSPAILTALASDDVEIRALAATLLGRSAKDPAAWAAAAVDPAPDVRVAYHEAISDAPVDIRLEAARSALAKNDPQLRREGASVAGGTLSAAAVEMLIPLLADPAASDIAGDGLFFLLGRYFDSAEEATAWWLANRQELAAELAPE